MPGRRQSKKRVRTKTRRRCAGVVTPPKTRKRRRSPSASPRPAPATYRDAIAKENARARSGEKRAALAQAKLTAMHGFRKIHPLARLRYLEEYNKELARIANEEKLLAAERKRSRCGSVSQGGPQTAFPTRPYWANVVAHAAPFQNPLRLSRFAPVCESDEDCAGENNVCRPSRITQRNRCIRDESPR